MAYDFQEEKKKATENKAAYEAFAKSKKSEGEYLIAAEYYIATGKLDEALDCYEQHIQKNDIRYRDSAYVATRMEFYPILKKSVKEGDDTKNIQKNFMEFVMEKTNPDFAEAISKTDPDLVLQKIHDYLREIRKLERRGETENAAELAEKKGDIERAIKNYVKVLPNIIEARLSHFKDMGEAVDLKNYTPAPRKGGVTIDDKINELMKEIPGPDNYRDRAETMREEGRKDRLVSLGEELESEGKAHDAARHYVAADKDDRAIELLEKKALESDPEKDREASRAYVDATWLSNKRGDTERSKKLRKNVDEKWGNKAVLAILIPIAISLALAGKNLFSNSTGYAVSGVPLFPLEYVIILIAGIAAFFIIAASGGEKKELQSSGVKFFYK